MIKVTSIAREKSVVQFDSTKHHRFSLMKCPQLRDCDRITVLAVLEKPRLPDVSEL